MEWQQHQRRLSLKLRSKAVELDRRQEQRFPESGEILLLAEGSQLGEIRGVLVDLSDAGFRAAHNCPALSAGLVAYFFHSRAEGLAQVVWTRISGDSVESGLRILRQKQS